MVPPDVKALIIDMDGVLWRGEEPIGDLPAIFARIRERGLQFVFATNNSTKTAHEYVAKFEALGVREIKPEQIITSAHGVSELIAKEEKKGAKVFVVGENGLVKALEDRDMTVITSLEDAHQAEVVCMGMDRQITFDKAGEATLLIRKGCPFYASNADKTFPGHRGQVPGAGAWLSVLTTATGVEPKVAGKPSPALMHLSLERMGVSKEQTLVVGDRLDTDIAGGQAAGCRTALVLTGISPKHEGEQWEPSIDIIVEDLATLIG
ncbi:Acid sugar phosphatase [Diplonema papillatum]|nr:Acid sugar phosphatase [Diplonema papillatum]|eukprot:gene11936-18417_t